MAVQGPFKVECNEVFPFGVGIVGEVSELVDFDRSTKENRVQARDKETGLPVWTVDVMDFDPEARERVLKVKISAPVRPVPPSGPVDGGVPVRPVHLDDLLVTPYMKELGNGRSKVAYSLRASGMSPVKAGGQRRAGSGEATAA